MLSISLYIWDSKTILYFSYPIYYQRTKDRSVVALKVWFSKSYTKNRQSDITYVSWALHMKFGSHPDFLIQLPKRIPQNIKFQINCFHCVDLCCFIWLWDFKFNANNCLKHPILHEQMLGLLRRSNRYTDMAMAKLEMIKVTRYERVVTISVKNKWRRHSLL